MTAEQDVGPQIYDIAIIGGGINGCGIARDAAGRGLSVFLSEMDDLGSGTSSRSTKLIHGGLRYLEHFDFRLVREALTEREVLWAIAPHIVHPLRFVLPHRQGLRPAWMLRVGLFLYDHLGGRDYLPGTRLIDLRTDPAGQALEPGAFTTGFEYSDCWVDDARLVVLNARDAADRGAVIRTRTRAMAAERRGGLWHLSVTRPDAADAATIRARILVNAAGPWVGQVARLLPRTDHRERVRLVQGSHVIVRKLFDHDRAYIFQSPDGRVVFAIPYEEDFTLIGTTDRDYDGDPAAASASEEEIAYLCETASASFARRITPADAVWTYAGVRPLFDDGASDAKSTSREYVLELDDADGAPPLLSIIGGKITTYRRLAEAALERLAPHLPQRAGLPPGWTGTEPLPGGDLARDGAPLLAQRIARSFPFLQIAHAQRLARAYGTRAWRLLGGAKTFADLGLHFGATLTEAEVRYLLDHEWACTAEDVLWRRTKLGLRFDRDQAEALSRWLAEAARPSPVELAR
jgi:glycerol-3-phosphate dehydrogenase